MWQGAPRAGREKTCRTGTPLSNSRVQRYSVAGGNPIARAWSISSPA
jgi:hypothetical protein